MRRHRTELTPGPEEHRRPGPPPSPDSRRDEATMPGRDAPGNDPAQVVALQRTVGNRAVGRSIGWDQHEHGVGCGHVTPTGTEARRGADGGDRHALARELTHAVQQRLGSPVAGRDDAPTPIQRYLTVAPGAAEYPQLGTAESDTPNPNFFPAQVPVDDSYVGPDGSLHVEYLGQAPLRISDKLDLAIEDTGGSWRQAKTFFATERRIAEANANLKGRVRFEAGSDYLELRRTRRFLKVKIGEQEQTLWQVEPVRYSVGGVEMGRGLDVRLAQRCNEMATAVTNRQGLAVEGEERYFDAIARLLGALTPTSAAAYRQQVQAAKAAASRDASAANVSALSAVYAAQIGAVMDLRADERFPDLVSRFGLNAFTPPPQIGDVLMIKSLERDASSGELDFHFAGVVARSGTDYVTMENFARHESTATLSSGDPQWYFQMYGTADPEQSFHREWDWEGRFPGRFTLTIRLGG
ncbi:hypothetical protein ACGFI4_29940 [Micromonospora carbonacea]|uniref:hypothetical protein n=1 Tax=Micromonospora carbonacea TaxID=47853 RepID=UPI00371E6458